MDGSYFAISYRRGLRPLFAALGMSPARSGAWLTPTALRVRMGWAFAADIPISALRSVVLDADHVGGWGVHGWDGRWLVNGSSTGLVRLVIEPTAGARVVGVPVRLRRLRLSLAAPGAFLAEISALLNAPSAS